MSEQAASRGGDHAAKLQRNYTLLMLVLVYTSNHVDRQIVAILAESIKQELLLSDTQLGFLIGLSFALFYATLGIPIALFADRLNRRNIIAASVMLWSVMTALCGLATNFLQLALARIGVGIGEAGSSPPSHSIISDLFPLEQRAWAMGIFAAGINLGVLIGFAVGGWVDELFGWRNAFFVVGIPGVFLGLLLLLTVREPARTVAPAPLPDNIIRDIWATFMMMLGNHSLRHILIGCAIAVFVAYGTVYWNGVYFRRVMGLSPSEAGTLLALMTGLVGGAGTLFGGWLADWLARRDKRYYVWLTAMVKLAAVPLVVTLYLTQSLIVAGWMLGLSAFIVGAYLPVSFSMVQSLMPPQQRALAAALLLFCINILGLGFGPYLVGIMSDAFTPYYGVDGLRYALALLAGVNVWAAFHYWWAGKDLRENLKIYN